MRLIFFGTPELACYSLEALAQAAGFSIVGVVTQPDRPRGRQLKLQPPPAKSAALRLGLPVLQPERARNPDFIGQLRELAPELIAVAAYGQILPPAILGLPAHGCLNVHTSLLPRYRGAAPIQRAILNGDAETGVTIMKMDAGLDTGDILRQRTTPIAPDDTAETLHDRLGKMGAKLLVETIPDYVAGRIRPLKQPEEGVSYARKITREDGALRWSRPAVELGNCVRALTPWPGSFTLVPGPVKTTMLKIWRAEVAAETSAPAGTIVAADKHGIVVACGVQSLRLLEVQPEGGRRMTTAEFLAGHALPQGLRLAH